jgi:hypothetical protein
VTISLLRRILEVINLRGATLSIVLSHVELRIAFESDLASLCIV